MTNTIYDNVNNLLIDGSSKKLKISNLSVNNTDDYLSMSSNFRGIHYSDLEGSKLLILPYKNKSVAESSSSIKFNSNMEYDKFNLDAPLGTSSPLNKIIDLDKYDSKTNTCNKRLKTTNLIKPKSPDTNKCTEYSGKTSLSLPSHYVPNWSVKSISPINNKKLSTENLKNRKDTSSNIINSISQVHFNNIKDTTTMKSSITLQNHRITKNISTKDFLQALNCSSNTIIHSKLNNVEHIGIESTFSDQVYLCDTNLTNKSNIERNKKTIEETSFILNSLQMTHSIYQTEEHNKLNETDSSELFQIELSLKMFSGNIIPYLNTLKHDVLRFIDNCKYEPYTQTTSELKCISYINKHIVNIVTKFSMDTCMNNKSKYVKNLIIPFDAIDLNPLNLLNTKLENIDKLSKLVKSNFDFKTLMNKNNNESNQKNSNVPVHDGWKAMDTSNTSENLKQPIKDTIRNFEVSSIKATNESDSFDHIRKLNRSNTPCINYSTTIQESFFEQSDISSLKNGIELHDKEVLEIKTPDINLSYKDLIMDSLISANESHSSNSQEINCDILKEEKIQNRYWLRNCPKPTNHFISPFNYTFNKKAKRKTNNYNDVFVSKGRGKKKKIIQYRYHSVFDFNPKNLVKKLCPKKDDNDAYNKDYQNSSVVNTSQLKPKKIDKPCRCGIFPSQVPSSWNYSLHETFHQNLHKLQFKKGLPVEIVNQINDNGLLYDIIQIDGDNCDKNVKLILKNIQDFINLELGSTKKNIKKLNQSILLAVSPDSKIIAYLETESLKKACIYCNNQLSENLVSIKFGVYKLWVMVKYRNCGIATKLLKQFSDKENLSINDIGFSYHGNHRISFIKKYFGNNSILIY